MPVYVWSGYWGAYYCPEAKGYTGDKAKAGVFDFEKVKHLLGESYRDKKIKLIPAGADYEI